MNESPSNHVTVAGVSPGNAESFQYLLAQVKTFNRTQLLEALRGDQSRRWSEEDPVWIEVYLDLFPALRADEEGTLDLLYSEVLLREEQGQAPAVDEYLRRFPQYKNQVLRQFTLHQAIQLLSLPDVNAGFAPDLTTSTGAGTDETSAPALPPRQANGVEQDERLAVTPGPQTKTVRGGVEAVAGPDQFPPTVFAPTRPDPPPQNAALPDLPGFEVLEELGRGGMGVVYKARQVSLQRPVALKMILADPAVNQAELAAFRSEAVKLASLHHAHIIQVYDVGEEGGRPFFSMEFMDGGNLAQKFAGRPQMAEPAASLMETLARAMHCVHEQGIVHRDLKPANVLLATDGTPKITDFGLAKNLQFADGKTLTSSINERVCLGTPPYMSPEQATGQLNRIGPATDVYALGAILYEALTGKAPFLGATTMGTLMQVVHEEPVPPRRLQPRVPPELETICLKCLEKDPLKRYASALALAEDLRRFQAGEPIHARPASAWQKVCKWARRRPAVAALAAVCTLVTLLAFTLVTWKWQETRVAELEARHAREIAEAKTLEADQQRRRAEAELQRAQTNLYLNRLALAEREWLANRVARADAILNDCPPSLRGWEWRYLKHLCHADRFTLHGHDHSVLAVAYRPDGKQLASAGEDQAIKLWDSATGRETLSLQGHTGWVYRLAYSPDGKQLASASRDSTIKVWDSATGKDLLTLKGHASDVLCVAYRPDGALLASGGEDNTIRIWDPANPQAARTLKGHLDAVTSVAFCPGDPQQLASGSDDHTVKVWDLGTGQARLTLLGHTDSITRIAYSPDGKRLASAGQDGTVKVWDAANGQDLVTLRDHNYPVYSVAFSPDGKLLVTANGDQTVKVWDAATGQDVAIFRGHVAPVLDAVFSPDGKSVASAGSDHTVKVWDATTGQDARSLHGHGNGVYAVAFSPDGKRVASCSGEPPIQGEVKLWDADTGGEVLTFRGHQNLVHGVAFSPNGWCAASAGEDQAVRVWSLASGKELLTLADNRGSLYSVVYSPNGRWIASAGEGQDVKLWDAATGADVVTFRGHTDSVLALAFSTDSSRLASAGADQTVKVWDVATGKKVLDLQGHTKVVYGVAYSPDGQRIASAGEDGAVKVWDANTGQEMMTLQGHTDAVTGVAFSPDGRRLVSASQDQTVKVWDLASGQEALTLRGHLDHVTSVAFSPDGRRMASASWDKTVRIWDAGPPEEAPDPAP